MNGRRCNNRRRGIVPTTRAYAASESRLQQGRPMTISTRFALGISAAALSLSLGFASAVLAQDAMSQDLDFRNSLSRKDTTSRDTIAKDAKDQGHHWGAAFYWR